MYNNETGLYDRCDWLMAGDWFVDEEGLLYIVPLPDVVAEIEGPDNEVTDALNAACREHGRPTDEDVARLGLRRVPEVLKRFHPKDGYYNA